MKDLALVLGFDVLERVVDCLTLFLFFGGWLWFLHAGNYHQLT